MNELEWDRDRTENLKDISSKYQMDRNSFLEIRMEIWENLSAGIRGIWNRKFQKIYTYDGDLRSTENCYYHVLFTKLRTTETNSTHIENITMLHSTNHYKRLFLNEDQLEYSNVLQQ